MNRRDLFPTPFAADTLKSPEGIAELRRSIEAERTRDANGVQISNVGGWHSNTNMIDWGGEAARAAVCVSFCVRRRVLLRVVVCWFVSLCGAWCCCVMLCDVVVCCVVRCVVVC